MYFYICLYMSICFYVLSYGSIQFYTLLPSSSRVFRCSFLSRGPLRESQGKPLWRGKFLYEEIPYKGKSAVKEHILSRMTVCRATRYECQNRSLEYVSWRGPLRESQGRGSALQRGGRSGGGHSQRHCYCKCFLFNSVFRFLLWPPELRPPLRSTQGGFEHRSTWGFEHVKKWEQHAIKSVVTYSYDIRNLITILLWLLLVITYDPRALGPP